MWIVEACGCILISASTKGNSTHSMKHFGPRFLQRGRQKEWPRILNVSTNLGGKGMIDQYVQADRDGNGRVDQAEFTKLWMALKQEGPVSEPSFCF